MKKAFLIFLLSLVIPYALFSQDLVELLSQANQKAEDGKCLEAIRDYDNILSLKPDFSNAFVLKGLCYSVLGNPDSTCICFIEGIDRDNEYAKDYFKKYCMEYKPMATTDQFKAGKFTYLTWIADTMAYVQRDQEFQTEYSGNSAVISKFRIKWDSNTNYSLKLVETNDSDLSFLKKSDAIKVSILKTSENGYLYYFDYNGNTGFGKHQKSSN